jgi:outer membrane protein assembly factor BamB
VWSSPTVYDGKVYFGSGDYMVYCLNADNGVRIWAYETEFWVDSTPAIYDEKIYIGSFDHNVYCLDSSNGDEIWIYKTGGMVDSSPAVSDGKVYFGSQDGKVYCLDASNSNEIWSYSTGDSVRSSPAIADGKLFIGSMDYTVYCFGDEIINKRPDAPTIDGPINGRVGTEYDYIFNSTDPNGDDVYYYIKWGDGHHEVWKGPHPSRDDVIISHTYARQEIFIIEAKAKDIHGAESEWATLEVTMPRNKILQNSFILKLFQKFPNALPLLRYIFS